MISVLELNFILPNSRRDFRAGKSPMLLKAFRKESWSIESSPTAEEFQKIRDLTGSGKADGESKRNINMNLKKGSK
jgi:hypothetical protein